MEGKWGLYLGPKVRGFVLDANLEMSFTVNAVNMIGGSRTFDDKFDEEIKSVTGLKKIYYKIMRSSTSKMYKGCLDYVNRSLEKPDELRGAMVLHFIDLALEKGGTFPEEIMKKIEGSPRTDFNNKNNIERLLRRS